VQTIVLALTIELRLESVDLTIFSAKFYFLEEEVSEESIITKSYRILLKFYRFF